MKYIFLILFNFVVANSIAQQTAIARLGGVTAVARTNGQTATASGSIIGIFTLSSSANTSAGIYRRSDSVLIKTLWSNEAKNAGTIPVFWDKKDDAGNDVADVPYYAQMVSNNVTATWEGVIGNTSKNITGNSVYNQFSEGFPDMRIVGKKAIFCVEYNEGKPAEFYFNTDSPQVRQQVWPPWMSQDVGLISARVCTDGTNVYFGGVKRVNYTDVTARTFVYARRVSDFQPVIFSSGISVNLPNILNYSAVDVVFSDTNHTVDGMAVQKTGSYLFVARLPLNKLDVINKTTGAVVQSVSYSSPGYLDTDTSGNLWMITGTDCKKYTVNSGGTLSAATITLSGLVKPLAVQVSPDNSKVYVVDGGSSQQVKIYNNLTGALISSFGQAGGYATSPVVTNDKFMFGNTKTITELSTAQIESSFLCFDASDNSYWVWDRGNFRVLHFSSANAFIESIESNGYNYACTADFNNPTRIFSNYLEYEVDYGKPLGGTNGSWRLNKNWAYGITGQTDNTIYQRMKCVYTLSNGRTYALNGIPTGMAVVELSPSGLRYTGTVLGNQVFMQKDGSLWEYSNTGDVFIGTATWTKKALTGFDSTNNPKWSNASIMANVPFTDSMKLHLSGSGFKFGQVLPDGKIVQWVNNKSTGAHLALLNPTTSKPDWITSYSTNANYHGEFPTNGDYDVGNNVNFAGGACQTIDNFILWGYIGEFWKAAQVNRYNLYYRNGLLVGHFGTDRPLAQSIVKDAPAEMAGNAINLALIKIGSDYYLYHADESFHGGLHRWKISGLNTVELQTLNIAKTTLLNPAAPDYTNLVASLPLQDTLITGTAGWTHTITTGVEVTTGQTTYKKGENDVYISSGGAYFVNRDLGTNTNLNNWSISGQLSYFPNGEQGTNDLEILDGSNKVIARIRRADTYPNATVTVNGANEITTSNLYLISKLQPFYINITGSVIKMKYSVYPEKTVELVDGSADITNPKTLHVYHNGTGAHVIDLANLKFYSTSSGSNTYNATIVPDFERRTGSVTGNLVTIPGRVATTADIGKNIILKNCRDASAVQISRLSFNGKVTGLSAGKLVVSSGSYGDDIEQLRDGDGVEILIGTNHWDDLQTAINAAPISYPNGISTKKIYLNWAGTVSIDPFTATGYRATYPSISDGAFRGMTCDGVDSILIYGRDSATTKFHLIHEDVTDDGAGFPGTFMFLYSTSLCLQRLTFEAPDRASTYNASPFSLAQGVNGARSIYLKNFQLLSPNINAGWEAALRETNEIGDAGVGINGHKLDVWAENSKLECAYIITCFSQNGAVKRVHVENTRLTGGGRLKAFLPYTNCVAIDTSGAVPLVQINNSQASFQQSLSYLPYWDRKPYCMFYPPAQDTITLTYSAPGQGGTDAYGNGQINLTNNTVNLGDGQEHYVYMRWLNGTDQVSKYINDVAGIFPHPGSNVPTNARTRYTSGGNYAVNDQNFGDGAWYYMSRNILTQLPVRMKMISGVLTLMEPLGAYALPDAGADVRTARLWNATIGDECTPQYTTAVSRSFMRTIAGGSVLIQGRYCSVGEGHAMYIHPNTELYLDNIHFNQDGQLGQANYYLLHYYSSTGVPGTHSSITVRRIYANTTSIPYFSSIWPLLPDVEVTGPNFTGTATIGNSLQKRDLIGVPYNLISD